jgi:hypothetical protein
MICPKCKHRFKDHGKVKGGQKSKRVLSPEDAKAMVKAREKKKAVKREEG